MTADAMTAHGTCAPAFERVREAFLANFAEPGELGASVAVVVDGEMVVDIWAGHADAALTRPWERDTIVTTYSTTKGMTALCAHLCADRDLPSRTPRCGSTSTSTSP